MYQYETSKEIIEKSFESPYRYKMIQAKTRIPSAKTVKTKISEYTNARMKRRVNLLNLYPNNMSIDYSRKTKNSDYNFLNYTTKNTDDNNIIKEKNIIINNLQNQINKYILKIKENNKKINLQEQMINSLKDQNKQLNNDLIRKKNIIEQNEEIDYKITKLKKDVEKSRDKKLNDEFNESKRHNFILNNKINSYKQVIKEKNDIINKLNIKNESLLKIIKDNEMILKNKNYEINKLNEENNIINFLLL